MDASVRRIVTGHDPQGRAVVRRDERLETQTIPSGEARFVKLWTTDRSPADNGGDADAALKPTGLTCPGGSVLRVVDMLPGARSPMHRTHSVDYGIVMQGELDMELDSGERVSLKPGDVVVQRGTSHAWVNRSAHTVRMVFVLIEAAPVMHAGQPLPELHDH